MSQFEKPALTVDELLNKLRERGLSVADPQCARHYLSNISYYRLSAYMRPFYVPHQDKHSFLPGTSFEQVLDLYIFDRELRLLLLDAIERLEVALRAQMTNTLAEHHGPHGYLDAALFDTRYDHVWLMDTLAREMSGRDVAPFVEHYRSKYHAAPTQPPIWMGLELLTFKQVSTLFSQLRIVDDRRRISQHFGWPDTVLHSWFRCLSDLRNHCAHHARIWNREFGSYPVLPRKVPAGWASLSGGLNSQRRVYMLLVVIETLMRVACPDSRWSVRLMHLLKEYPAVSQAHMGFPTDWQQQAFWQPVVKAADEISA